MDGLELASTAATDSPAIAGRPSSLAEHIDIDGEIAGLVGAASKLEADIAADPTPAKASAPADPWAKDGIFVRLSKKRKAKLQEIAKRLGCDDNPHQAIVAHIEGGADAEDAALEEPAQPGMFQVEVGRRFDEVVKTVGAMEDRVAFLIERLGDALSPLTDIAQPPEPKAESLPAWLSRIQAERGAAITKLALARAKWIATHAGQSGRLAMDFEMELLNIDGQPARPVPVGRVRIDGANPAWRFTSEVHASNGQHIVLTCQPTSLGRWNITAFYSAPDGRLGDKFATFAW
jgi:hypothetical protein